MKGEWGEVQFSAAPTLGLLASTVTLSASAVAAPSQETHVASEAFSFPLGFVPSSPSFLLKNKEGSW